MKLKICLFAALFALTTICQRRACPPRMALTTAMASRHVPVGQHRWRYHTRSITRTCVEANTCPNLASIARARTGVNYTRTTASRPSDYVPWATDGSAGRPRRDTEICRRLLRRRLGSRPCAARYNHREWTGRGNLHPRKKQRDTDRIRGRRRNQPAAAEQAAYKSVIDGSTLSLGRRRVRYARSFLHACPCAPVYPWNFITATNTIFRREFTQLAASLHQSDKHAVYAAVSGPTGTSQPSNVDDYYSPEVNSNQIPLPGITTAGTHFDCGTIKASGSATVPGNDWTTDLQAIQCYDQLKANAVVNWINGKPHLGGNSNAPVPVIFGMNFQAVSVGEKLIEGEVKGGLHR